MDGAVGFAEWCAVVDDAGDEADAALAVVGRGWAGWDGAGLVVGEVGQVCQCGVDKGRERVLAVEC